MRIEILRLKNQIRKDSVHWENIVSLHQILAIYNQNHDLERNNGVYAAGGDAQTAIDPTAQRSRTGVL